MCGRMREGRTRSGCSVRKGDGRLLYVSTQRGSFGSEIGKMSELYVENVEHLADL